MSSAQGTGSAALRILASLVAFGAGVLCLVYGYLAIEAQQYDGTPVLFGVGLVLVITSGVVAFNCFNDHAVEIPQVMKFNKISLGGDNSSGSGIGNEVELGVMADEKIE